MSWDLKGTKNIAITIAMTRPTPRARQICRPSSLNVSHHTVNELINTAKAICGLSEIAVKIASIVDAHNAFLKRCDIIIILAPFYLCTLG